MQALQLRSVYTPNTTFYPADCSCLCNILITIAQHMPYLQLFRRVLSLDATDLLEALLLQGPLKQEAGFGLVHVLC